MNSLVGIGVVNISIETEQKITIAECYFNIFNIAIDKIDGNDLQFTVEYQLFQTREKYLDHPGNPSFVEDFRTKSYVYNVLTDGNLKIWLRDEIKASIIAKYGVTSNDITFYL